jgi:hypothetical protein
MRTTVAAVIAVAAALAVAGCGSTAGQTSAAARYGPRSSPIAMSRCMRANGLTNFPDPQSTTGGEGFPGGVIATSADSLVVDGITFAGPAYERAAKACAAYLPPGGPPPKLSAQQLQRVLAFARCMRHNGVPSFSDPDANRTGPLRTGGTQAALPAADSPAFQHAAQVCGVGSHRGISLSAP